MAKEIKYKVLASEFNCGTEEVPNIKRFFMDKFFICPTKESYEKMYPIAQEEAIGEIIVEGEFDSEEPSTPTQEERIAALEEENAMLMECILEMSEIVYA